MFDQVLGQWPIIAAIVVVGGAIFVGVGWIESALFEMRRQLFETNRLLGEIRDALRSLRDAQRP